MYIYQSHMGGLFVTDEELDFDQTYCEICGDFDFLIGYAETREEAWELLKYDTNIMVLVAGTMIMFRNF